MMTGFPLAWVFLLHDIRLWPCEAHQKHFADLYSAPRVLAASLLLGVGFLGWIGIACRWLLMGVLGPGWATRCG